MNLSLTNPFFCQPQRLPLLGSEGIKNPALAPAFVDTPMTDFIKGQVPAEQMIQVGDIAESVRFLLRLSPGCVVPEIMFEQPGANALGTP